MADYAGYVARPLMVTDLNHSGLEAARARGRSEGRKKIASDNPKVLTQNVCIKIMG
jgi:hypothetical protein